jgi:hypothetical protein
MARIIVTWTPKDDPMSRLAEALAAHAPAVDNAAAALATIAAKDAELATLKAEVPTDAELAQIAEMSVKLAVPAPSQP